MTFLQHHEYLRLLSAVLADPEDDAPRLVLADWLDERPENGARLYAEFIRVQCRLARWKYADCTCTLAKNLLTIRDPNCPHNRHDALKARERELLETVGPSAWSFPWLGGRVGYAPVTQEYIGIAFRRGFVETMTMPADCLRHMEAVRKVQPVAWVELSTWPDLAEMERVEAPSLKTRIRYSLGRKMGGWFIYDSGSGVVVPFGREPLVQRRDGEGTRSYVVRELLAVHWPRVDFTLPPSRTGPVMGRNPTLSVRQADGTWRQVFPGGER